VESDGFNRGERRSSGVWLSHLVIRDLKIDLGDINLVLVVGIVCTWSEGGWDRECLIKAFLAGEDDEHSNLRSICIFSHFSNRMSPAAESLNSVSSCNVTCVC